MSSMSEELNHRLGWMRDEQARTNASFETRIKELQGECADLRLRLTVLTRLLISKQVATAEEIAAALAAAMVPATETTAPETPPAKPS